MITILHPCRAAHLFGQTLLSPIVKSFRPITNQKSIEPGRLSFNPKGTHYFPGKDLPTMPRPEEIKTKPRILATEILKKRKESKEKSQSRNYVFKSADIQILGTCKQGSVPSILVNSENNSYLFNCGEGFQRYCYTNKIKLTNLENVFITNHDWSRVAGIFGLGLTLQDLGSPKLCVHSTEAIKDLFFSSRTFMIFNTGMHNSTKSHLNGPHMDTGIHIEPILLDPGSRAVNVGDDDIDPELAQKKARMNPRLVTYVCSLPDLPGKLDPMKCKELGVPVGPLLAKFKAGENVTLPDGRLIKSTDVIGPRLRGETFIVIECPSEDDISSLMANDRLNEVRKLRWKDNEKEVCMVVHFSPTDVTNNPRYKRWMEGFSENCKHLLLFNPQPKSVDFIDTYRMQYLLRKLDDVIFPSMNLPPSGPAGNENMSGKSGSSIDNVPGKDADLFEVKFDSLPNKIEVNSLDKFCLRPNKALETSSRQLNLSALYNEAVLQPYFEENFDELKKLQKNMPQPRENEPEVVFLGTGSAVPGKLRNTSCILVNFYHREPESILLDCGEGSYAQMLRLYGPTKTRSILSQLKLIYVSHHHTDHHIGMIEILRQRKKLTDDPVVLLLPPGIERLLDYQNQNFEDLSDAYVSYSTRALKTEPVIGFVDNATINTIKSSICEKLGGLLHDIHIVGVDHCMNSCAVSMTLNIGHPGHVERFTVAYSGDARPSDDFVMIGKGCDLLIHEATFDFRSNEDAQLKKHCTSAEAIKIAKKMEAKFTILTHFSQRLPKIPYFTPDFDETIGFAFDNMAIRCPSHFSRIPILKTVLSVIFKKSLDEVDIKFVKHEQKTKKLNEIVDRRFKVKEQ